MVDRPRSRAASVTSRRTTWWPACGLTWAMPEPMSPAPTTVIFCCCDMARTVTSALARGRCGADTEEVAQLGSYSFVYGPVVAFAMVGLLVLLLRWAFSRGSSLVAAPPRPGAPDDYGLLVPVASPASFAEAEL